MASLLNTATSGNVYQNQNLANCVPTPKAPSVFHDLNVIQSTLQDVLGQVQSLEISFGLGNPTLANDKPSSCIIPNIVNDIANTAYNIRERLSGLLSVIGTA